MGTANLRRAWLAIGLFCPAAAAQSLHEAWDAAYIAGVKVGYIHTMADQREAAGQLIVHVRQQSELAIKRFSDSLKIRAATDSFELADGRLYATESRMQMGNEPVHSRGTLKADGKFHLTRQTPAGTEEQTLDWFDDILGPFAHERLLREQPLKPGESRAFRTFLPELNLVATSTLQAVGKEKTPLRDGKQAELLKVEMTTHAGDQKLPATTLWLDDKGDLVKSAIALGPLAMTTLRVTKAEALGEPVGDGFDLGFQTLVKTAEPIPNAHRSRAVTYRLELADAKSAEQVPAASYQEIVRRQGNQVWITVRRKTPNKSDQSTDSAATRDFLDSNGFIQSDDPRIQDAARQATGGVADPWERARRLERWVDQNMTNRDFSAGLDSASTVIKTRQGDCTEHAVLLAALCRAAGIPARVAMGLVYLESAQAFGYHMWTEVYIGGDWYAIDGTLGQGYVAGGHIKLLDSSLKGASAFSTILPILNFIGKLRIAVEKVEP
jgi:hypothetical protein